MELSQGSQIEAVRVEALTHAISLILLLDQSGHLIKVAILPQEALVMSSSSSYEPQLSFRRLGEVQLFQLTVVCGFEGCTLIVKLTSESRENTVN